MEAQKPQIVIINGTSSAGKSSTAEYICKNTEDNFLHFQWDTFLKQLPENTTLTSEETKDLSTAFRKAACEHLSNGQSLILDVVCVPGEVFKELVDTFSLHNPITVRIKASPDTLKEREIERGDRKTGLALSQHNAMYEIEQHPEYDLELDSTSTSVEELGQAIMNQLPTHNAKSKNLDLP